MQAAAPGEPFVGGARALVEVGIDAHVLQLLDHLLGAEVLFGAYAQEEVVNLLVEVWAVEDTVSDGVNVHAEESA